MGCSVKIIAAVAALALAACATTPPIGDARGAAQTAPNTRSEPGKAPPMRTVQDQNLAVIRAYVDAFNRHDLDAALALWSPDARNHGRPVGRAGVRMVHEDIVARAPDIRFDLKEMVAVDEYVIFRALYQGTHLGVGRLPVDGGQLIGVPPTGKAFSVQHIHWFTLADGEIVDHRANRDDVAMLVQLGLLPAPPPFTMPPAGGNGPKGNGP